MKKRISALVLLAVALSFIIIGIAQGDFMDTLHKAAAICLECIGIG
jgi:hypothetical protein